MMEQMRLELKKAGYDVQFVAINLASAQDKAYQDALVYRCAFPLLQDLDEVGAASLHHHGSKDDFYVYSKDGKLFDYLPIVGPRNTVLATEDGYKNVKDAIIAATKR